MADLKRLYKDYGFSGVLPYAFGEKGKGYNFVCSLLLSGEPFWMIYCSESIHPFIHNANNRNSFLIFSSKDRADVKCQGLAAQGYTCNVQELTPRAEAPRFFERCRDLGVDSFIFDDSVLINITDLAGRNFSKGYINESTPVYNSQLNLILYTIIQNQCAGYDVSSLFAAFWEELANTDLIVPLSPTKEVQSGESISLDDLEPHQLVDDEGGSFLPVLTDTEFFAIYAEERGLSNADSTCILTPSLTELLDYLNDNPTEQIVINPYRGTFILSAEDFKIIQQCYLNAKASGTI